MDIRFQVLGSRLFGVVDLGSDQNLGNMLYIRDYTTHLYKVYNKSF